MRYKVYLIGILGSVIWAYIVDLTYKLNEFWSLLFFDCIFSPIWEEAAYRYAPITIARLLGEDFVLPIIILSSASFGWGHGDSMEGVLLQGVLGLIFSWVYLKGGLKASIFVHIAYNSIIWMLE